MAYIVCELLPSFCSSQFSHLHGLNWINFRIKTTLQWSISLELNPRLKNNRAKYKKKIF